MDLLLVDRAVAWAAAISGGTATVVGEGASPLLKEQLAARTGVATVPAVRGRAVWHEAPPDAPIVIEQPNYVGRRELLPAARRALLVQTSGCVALPDGWSRVTASGRLLEPGDPPLEEAVDPALRMAAGLRTRLLQLRGVVAAFPTIEAPWFLLLLPVDPGLVLPDLPDGLVSAAAVELRGHPGAVRFAVDPEAVPAAIRQYASAVETALRRARGGD